LVHYDPALLTPGDIRAALEIRNRSVAPHDARRGLGDLRRLARVRC
jgi:hypothetical protein